MVNQICIKVIKLLKFVIEVNKCHITSNPMLEIVFYIIKFYLISSIKKLYLISSPQKNSKYFLINKF